MLKHALVRSAAVAVLLGSGAAVLGTGAVSFAAQSSSLSSLDRPSTYSGHTEPSEQRRLQFNGPGVVAKVYVKEGDFVKKGQLLAEQDSRAEEADLKAMQAETDSKDVEIKAAQETLEEKRIELQRKENMLKQRVIGDLEVMEARLDVTIEEDRADLARKEKEAKVLGVEAQKAKIGLKKLFATTDGIVQQIGIHEGELASNDPKSPVISVVTNEPLYVEVDLPVAVARNLKLHDKVQVRYEDESEDAWKPAEVIFFNPTGNAMARTQHVRMQLENPNQTRSGLNVVVKLDNKLASAQDAR